MAVPIAFRIGTFAAKAIPKRRGIQEYTQWCRDVVRDTKQGALSRGQYFFETLRDA
jgi:hypothetical protein